MNVMKKFALALSVLIVSSSLCGVAAFAETDSQRLDRLQNDLQIIQRQLARGGVVSGSTLDAQTEVRLSSIEDDIRNLRGKAEENEFQIRRLSETFDKLQRDMEFRFNELSKSQSSSQTSSPAPEASPPAADSDEESEPAPANPSDASSSNGPEFATSRDHYNHAFRLLSQTKYKEAAEAFADFTKKYPKDPLVGNAYYWQGETYYIRRDYVNAADMFRQGFEALPDGPKAADNLLKLAMSLSALRRDKEACIVLDQLSTRYVKVSRSIAARAVQEQKRIDCPAQKH